MASKSTTSKTTTEEEEKKKELIDRIAEKIKTDKNLSKNLQQVAPDELQTNLSDAIEGAVKALDDDEWEKKYKQPPLNWDPHGPPPQYVFRAVVRTGLYDPWAPQTSTHPSAALIAAVYAKLREKHMAQKVVRKLSLDKATEAGVAGNIRKFLGGKRTRKRRKRRRTHKRSKRRRTRRRRKTKRKRRRIRRRR
jgi:hypothetical protein